MSRILLQANSVSKVIRQKCVIDNIDLTLHEGKIVALLGLNGAGKSTLLKLLSGLMKPNRGSIRLNNINARKPIARSALGVMLQNSEFVNELSGRDIMQFVGQHYNYPQAATTAIASFQLEDFIDKPTAQLSPGQKRSLHLALVFIGKPNLVFLDEPTVGMDYPARTNFWCHLKNFKKQNNTALFTTHYLEEAQQMADEIYILHEGKLEFMQNDMTVKQLDTIFRNKVREQYV